MSRVAQILPFIDFLEGIGAPVERGLEAHKLRPDLRERPYAVVGTAVAFGFAADMARQQGIEDFGWRVADPRLTQMSPRLRKALYRSPTLLHALERMCEGVRGESSNVRFWLEDRGDDFYLYHKGSLRVGVPGLDEASEMRTAIIVMVIRLFTGSDWVLPECGLTMKGTIGPLVREALPDTRILSARGYGWIRLPRSILACPPRILVPSEEVPRREGEEAPARELTNSLVQLLHSFPSAAMPSLHEVADIADTSVRSLQRELSRGGSSYREILQRVKFDQARELLKQRDVKILEIAYELGFGDAAHFTRFFRKIAGLTPREYRTEHTKQSD
jgi:AraC-like DNA-binding protein